MAYAKGQYDQMKLISEIKPYWIYTQIERNTKRHDHALLHGKKFRHDDPIWNTIFPPSGFGCKCSVTPTKDGEGVENGADYLEQFKDSEDFQLSPLKAWEPDTSKYVEGIKQKLEEMLKKKVDPNGDLPDCDGHLYVGSSHNLMFGDKKCIKILPNQKTWKDYNRIDLKELDEEQKLDTPEIIKPSDTVQGALEILFKALNIDDTGKRILKTPVEDVILNEETLRYIANKPGNREKFANFIIPTLEQPFEVYEVDYEDGKRNHYIGVFKGERGLFCIIRINKDGSLLWNVIPTETTRLNNKRLGKLLE